MAGNGNRTYIEPEAVRTAGDNIGGLLSDMSPFQQCASAQTQAGNFDAATWLEDTIHARQTDLLQHATHVKMVCGEINEGLVQVSDTLQNTDSENGQYLGRDIDHAVYAMRFDSNQAGGLAHGIAHPPSEWGSQAFDGSGTALDQTPPPTFESVSEQPPAEPDPFADQDPFTMNDTIPTL